MKKIILVGILIIVAVFIFSTKINKNNSNHNKDLSTLTPQILGPNKDDLIEFSVKPGSVISGKITVTGSVKNAYFFEGNIVINLLDSNQNILKAGNGTATTDWMTTAPVSFTANVDSTGLNGSGYIEIRNDDPSDGEGGPAKIILVPVVFN